MEEQLRRHTIKDSVTLQWGVLTALVVSFLFFYPLHASAATDREIDMVLSAAESHFQAMKRRAYPEIWELLTVRSKNTIIREVRKSSRDVYSEEQVATDFTIGGIIARSYWNAFLNVFDPDTVLELSRWEMGRIKGKKAEIFITYKNNTERPAILKMYKEGNRWKVGLVETFWKVKQGKVR